MVSLWEGIQDPSPLGIPLKHHMFSGWARTTGGAGILLQNVDWGSWKQRPLEDLRDLRCGEGASVPGPTVCPVLTVIQGSGCRPSPPGQRRERKVFRAAVCRRGWRNRAGLPRSVGLHTPNKLPTGVSWCLLDQGNTSTHMHTSHPHTHTHVHTHADTPHTSTQTPHADLPHPHNTHAPAMLRHLQIREHVCTNATHT